MEGRDARMSLGSSRDKNVDDPRYARNHGDLVVPDDPSLAAFISEVEATGGGDFAESLYDAALSTITALDWQAESRALVIITDAPPLTGALTTATEADVVAASQAASVHVMTILVGW